MFRSERTLDAVEHSRTLMEWWPFLIFHRGGLRIKVINNTRWGGEPCPSREHDPTWDGDLDTWIDFTGFVQLALEQIGEPAIQPVVQALERSKGNVEWLLRPLEMWGEEASRAVPALLRGLQEAEPHLRAGFIRTLGAIGPRAEEAVAVLKDLLDDPPVSAYAQRALDQIQPN